MRPSASTKAAAERCDTATPLGTPVDPDVKMIQASSSTVGGATIGTALVLGCGAAPSYNLTRSPSPSAGTNSPVPATIPRTPASPNTRRARSSGSSASTGTYAAPAAITARIETYSSFEPDGMRTPTRSPRRTPASCRAAAVFHTRASSSR